MSARVVLGLAPAGKPHPATKWSLLIALLVVVVLGVPKIASAGQPAVQAPTGSQSGGFFTGPYTFGTYISCSSGFSFNSSYSNNLDGTHTFVFYGAADGSLLVSIDGGGMMLVTSCGDPFTPPMTNVASFTVSKGTPPPPTPTPSPTPTPAPTHTPTPTPNGGGGGSGSSSSGGSGGAASKSTPAGGSGSGSSSGSAAGPAPASPGGPSATATGPGSAATPAVPAKPGSHPGLPPVAAASTPPPWQVPLAWSALGFGLLLLAGLVALVVRSQRAREWAGRYLTRFRLRAEPYWFRLHRQLTHIRRPHGFDQLKRRGLSPHHHSGKLLAHHHTSYPALAFLLLLSGVLAGAVSLSGHAASSLLSLTVTGPPPSTSATIDQPTDGQHFSDPAQTMRGTCPSGLFVEVWRNGAFAGSTVCDVNGLYAVIVTLVPGQNDLIARDLDALSQYGPDSATVSVFYDAPPPPPSPSPTPSVTPAPAPTAAPTATPRPPHSSPTPAPTPAPVPSLLLDSARHFYQGANVGDPVEWTVTVAGGRPPYNLTWEWGDGSSNTTFAAAAGDVKFQHNYAKPGIYQVTIRITDAAHHQAVLQLVVVVNGSVTSASLGQSTGDPGNLVLVWPLLTITGFIVLSFWLGEHHKLAILRPTMPRPTAT